jgi:hypothetical protein
VPVTPFVDHLRPQALEEAVRSQLPSAFADLAVEACQFAAAVSHATDRAELAERVDAN